MNILQMIAVFCFGGVSMWNFMRTTYVYGGITSFYALDFVVMLLNFGFAWLACQPLIVGRR